MLENKPIEETDISKIENEIHELAHIVHSQFFNKNQIICEGFAEALPLYALGFEEIFDEHRNSIINLSEDQVFVLKKSSILKKINLMDQSQFYQIGHVPLGYLIFLHIYL